MHHENRYFGPLPNHCACGQVHQAASSRASKHPQDKISYQAALLQWCAKVITREQLLHKELLTDRVARGKVFATLQECDIESESTWDDSDQRGSTNNVVARDADQREEEEEQWDETLAQGLGLERTQARFP